MSDCVGFDSNTVCVDNPCASGGSGSCNTTTITFANSPYSTLPTDDVILIDATLGNVIVNIIADPANDKKRYTFKRIDSTTNTITINPPVGDTIDGGASYNLPRETEVVTFCRCPIGAVWNVINEKLDRTLTTCGDIFVHNGTKIIRLPRGLNNQVLVTDDTQPGCLTWKTIAINNMSPYQIFQGRAVPTSPTPTPVAYYPWSNIQHGGFVSGNLVIRAIISPSPQFRDLTVRLIDVTNGPTVLAILSNIAATGTYITPITSFPPADAEVRLEISKNLPGGVNPQLIGALLEFS